MQGGKVKGIKKKFLQVKVRKEKENNRRENIGSDKIDIQICNFTIIL